MFSKKGGIIGNIGSGTGGAVSVSNNHIFTSTTLALAITARDSYFTTNPTELVNDVFAICQTSDGVTVRLYKYNLSTTTWQDVSTAIRGEKGETGATGATGPSGTNGTNGVDGINGKDMNWRGDWIGTTNYVFNDAVQYSGSSYYCINACENIVPTNTGYWSLIAAKGVDGEDGAGYSSKGGYNASMAYQEGNVVSKDGSSYSCIQPCLGIEPPNTSYWTLVAAKGDTGISGLTARGAYTTNTNYYINDVVEYAGSSYACYVACKDVLPTDTTKWAILVTKGAQGDQGAKGDKGDVGMVWKDTYDAATTYALNEVVFYNGCSWICVAVSTGNAPSVSSTFWSLVAKQGNPAALSDAGTWAPSTAYTIGAVVTYDGGKYSALVAHTSSATFSPDLSKWVALGGKSSMTDRGIWVTGTAYAIADVATYDGTRYACVSSHTASAAFTTDISSWCKLGVIKGITDKSNWVTGTTYSFNDIAAFDGVRYICVTTHTAGTFATDLSSGYWVITGNTNLLTEAGLWQTGSVYNYNDVITYDFNRFICKKSHTSSVTSFESDRSTYWTMTGISRKVTEKGTYTASQNYVYNDVVTYLGSRYLCINTHTSTTWATDSSNFVVLGSNYTATTLAYGSSSCNQGTTYTTLYPIAAGTWTTVTAAATTNQQTNIVSISGSLQFTITQAGKYRISAQSASTNTNGANWSMTRILLTRASVPTPLSTSPAAWVSSLSATMVSATDTVYDLLVGDVISCQAYTQYAGYMQGGYLTVEQEPSTTVVQAGTLTATDLGFLKAGGSASYTTTASAAVALPLTQVVGSSITYNAGIAYISKTAKYRIKFSTGSTAVDTSGLYKWFIDTSTDGSTWLTLSASASTPPAGVQTFYSPQDLEWMGTLTTGAYIRIRPNASITIGAAGDITTYPVLYIEELPSQSIVMVGDATSIGNAAKVTSIAQSATLSSLSGAGTFYTTTFTNTYSSIILSGQFSDLISTADGLLTVYIKVDGTTVGTLKNWQTMNIHTQVSYEVPVSGLAAGTHTLTFSSPTTTFYSNTNDFITINMAEFAPAGTYFQTSANIVEWQTYTPTLGVYSGTAPTKPTAYTERALYKVIGKTLYIKYTLYYTSGAGAATGTGAYSWSIPSGYTIDTNKVGVPSSIVATTPNYTPLSCISLGLAKVVNLGLITISPSVVVALSSTTIGVHMQDSNNTGLVGSNLWPIITTTPMCYVFDLEIPIL